MSKKNQTGNPMQQYQKPNPWKKFAVLKKQQKKRHHSSIIVHFYCIWFHDISQVFVLFCQPLYKCILYVVCVWVYIRNSVARGRQHYKRNSRKSEKGADEASSLQSYGWREPQYFHPVFISIVATDSLHWLRNMALLLLLHLFASSLYWVSLVKRSALT